MSLAERLAEPQKGRGGRTCLLCAATGQMDDADRQAVADAVASPDASDRWLSEQLKAEGFDVSTSSVGNHRRERHGL